MTDDKRFKILSERNFSHIDLRETSCYNLFFSISLSLFTNFVKNFVEIYEHLDPSID